MATLTKNQIHNLPVDKRNITLSDGTILRQGKTVQKTASQLASEWAAEVDVTFSCESDDELLFAVKR